MNRRRQTAKDRGIEGATMSGFEMQGIRERAGLSIYELASLLRYKDVDGLRRMERNGNFVSGPMQIVLEAIRDGKIDPDVELR